MRIFIFAALFSITFYVAAQPNESLDQKIGQMIMIGFSGTSVDERVLEDVQQGKVGAIIFFEKNVPPSNSFHQLKSMIWAYKKKSPLPLLIAIDQEGGKVNRLKEKYGFPRSISNQQMGLDASLDSVRFYGESTAATLSGLGINVNFAPVVDVAVNPDNPVIVLNERSFSASADTVTRMAKEFIKAHRKVQVITVLKHFPGHGSSKDDSHKGMADVTDTWSTLELEPYKTLMREGYVDAIMTSHIVNRQLDEGNYPGTLSKKMMDGLLRQQLGYDGVIFSDDMQMGAITEHYGLQEAVILAINAGVDILCFSNNINNSQARTVDTVHTIIKNAVLDGRIAIEQINQSYRRILALKKQLNTVNPPITDDFEVYKLESSQLQEEISTLQSKISELEKQVENHLKEAQTIPKKRKGRKKRN